MTEQEVAELIQKHPDFVNHFLYKGGICWIPAGETYLFGPPTAPSIARHAIKEKGLNYLKCVQYKKYIQ